jgi:uncharacterized membrane-anchored protein YhcB (DUF1043 family)
MLNHLRKIFASQEVTIVAEATNQEESVEMTTNTEQLSAVEPNAELAAQLASTASALTELQASFAELNEKYTEAAAKLADVEVAKASLVAEAVKAKLAARKEKLEFAVGTEKAATLLSTLEVLDDAAFDSVVSSMTTTLSTEAISPAFVESGVTAEAAEIKPKHFNKNRKS